MRESRLYGSVRGARGNSRPYREDATCCTAYVGKPPRADLQQGCQASVFIHEIAVSCAIEGVRHRAAAGIREEPRGRCMAEISATRRATPPEGPEPRIGRSATPAAGSPAQGVSGRQNGLGGASLRREAKPHPHPGPEFAYRWAGAGADGGTPVRQGHGGLIRYRLLRAGSSHIE